MIRNLPKGTLEVSGPGLEGLRKALAALTDEDILIGVPAAKADARPEANIINNATLGYVHEFGMPEHNLPARPWLVPGIRVQKKRLEEALRRVGQAALTATPQRVHALLEQVGILASTGVRKYIEDGIDPPLADSTLRKKAANGAVGAAQELAARGAGLSPSTEFVTPLIETGNFIRSITYVVVRRRDKKGG